MTEQERAIYRKAMREYKAEWMKKNPGKAKEYRERYWLKKGMKQEMAQSVSNRSGHEKSGM